jgi:hypothetical protein
MGAHHLSGMLRPVCIRNAATADSAQLIETLQKPWNLWKFGDQFALRIGAGGETGIRTLGGSHLNGFQDRRIRPLCHLSVAGLQGAI